MDGFHINPEAYAIILAVDNGFHVKPEAYAIIGSADNQPVLKLTISYNDEIFIVPFTTKAVKPAFIIRWNGIDWYNLLVSPNSNKASAVLIQYGGQIYALST